MISNEQLCYRIIRLIHTPIHLYDSANSCVAVYIDKGEQQDVLICAPELVQKLLSMRNQNHPILYIEDQNIIYGILCCGNETYILGPGSLAQETRTAGKHMIQKHNLDRHIPYKISYTPLPLFSEVVLMLHEQFTGITMEISELFYFSFGSDELIRSMEERSYQVALSFQENEIVHNPYSQEIHEQEAIAAGDLDALERSFEEPFVGEWGTLSHDSLRNAKNIAIVLIALACRSAIAGGLLPEIAFSMSDGFIQHSEKLDDVGVVIASARQAERKYCEAVRNISQIHTHNPLVKRCMELVTQKLHMKITAQDLANELKITPSYLSRLFVQEAGMNLKDYIAREKIEESKRQMIYTDHSLSQIAYSLGFSTQEHFGKVFCKVAGLTPGEYRKKYGRK